MYKISVIIPVYNVSEYLDECLTSVINQNYPNYEIIIVNDGSTDNSLEIAKKYQKKHKQLIKLYDKENGGLSSARNYGIKKSTGDYLLFVDSDDYILPNCLEVIGKNLNKKKCDILVYSFLVGEKNEYKKMYNDKIANPFKRYITGMPNAMNKVCKRNLFIENNIEFPLGLYYEDLATMPKFATKKIKIEFTEEPLYFYRIREGSIMNKKTYNEKVDAIFIVLEQLREYFGNKYQEEIEYLHIEHLLRSASVRYLDYDNCQEQLNKIVSIIKENYPNWKKNKYYKQESIKKRIMCNLFYNKQYKLISLLRKF